MTRNDMIWHEMTRNDTKWHEMTQMSSHVKSCPCCHFVMLCYITCYAIVMLYYMLCYITCYIMFCCEIPMSYWKTKNSNVALEIDKSCRREKKNKLLRPLTNSRSKKCPMNKFQARTANRFYKYIVYAF